MPRAHGAQPLAGEHAERVAADDARSDDAAAVCERCGAERADEAHAELVVDDVDGGERVRRRQQDVRSCSWKRTLARTSGGRRDMPVAVDVAMSTEQEPQIYCKRSKLYIRTQ